MHIPTSRPCLKIQSLSVFGFLYILGLNQAGPFHLQRGDPRKRFISFLCATFRRWSQLSLIDRSFNILSTSWILQGTHVRLFCLFLSFQEIKNELTSRIAEIPLHMGSEMLKAVKTCVFLLTVTPVHIEERPSWAARKSWGDLDLYHEPIIQSWRGWKVLLRIIFVS